jgi:glycosyltransferase involved in cell wall biosynthesis
MVLIGRTAKIGRHLTTGGASFDSGVLMRIAFMSWRDLANELAGGAEVFIDRLAIALVGMGHEVIHLCGGPVGERQYPVIEMGGTFSQYARAPFVHHRVAKDWDLLVDVEAGLPFFSPLWRRKAILACVHHVHSDQWNQRFSPPLAAAGRFAESRIMPVVYRRVPFIAVSPSTASALEEIGIDKRRIRVLRNGVDPPSISVGERSADPLFVCLGRLVPHKRVDLLLRVWDQVRLEVGGRLVVVGDGPERASLEALAGADVEFAGRVDDDEKWLLLSRAWALVHPAHHEGWGIVIIEAAQVGTPALGFKVPGVKDAIVDGVTGIHVSTEADLARRWIELATNSSLRDRLSDGARRYGSNFGWEEVAREFSVIAMNVIQTASGQSK